MLRVFVAAAEELNFSRAALRLRLSQSAVSQNIQSLELAYGVELFIRHGRSVQLSESGKAILPIAREVLASVRLLEDSLVNIKGEVAGELVIGCSTTTGKYLIPNLLSAYRKEYPRVHTRVSVMSRATVLEHLLDQTLGLGVVSKRVEHRDIECSLLFEDKVILIVPADHPWAKYGRAMPADLLEQPFIRREDGSATTEILLEGLKHHNITPEMLNVVMELGNAEASALAVERGMGITFVSELVAERGLALGRICKVDIDGLENTQRIYLCRHTGATFTRAESKFWDFVQQHREKLNLDMLQSLTGISHPAQG